MGIMTWIYEPYPEPKPSPPREPHCPTRLRAAISVRSMEALAATPATSTRSRTPASPGRASITTFGI